MRFRPLLILCTLAVHGVPLAAQQQLDIAASVPVRSPTGSGTRNLTFGTITPVTGTTQVVDVPAAAVPVSGTVQSGEFRYDVSGIRGVTFNVTTPTQLTTGGAAPLAMTANGTQYGGYCVTTGGACTLTSFNPGSGANVRVCRSILLVWCSPFTPWTAGSSLRIYVGGQLSVPPTAQAGLYAGTVTLTIVQVH